MFECDPRSDSTDWPLDWPVIDLFARITVDAIVRIISKHGQAPKQSTKKKAFGTVNGVRYRLGIEPHSK